jgi:hypothetical protein
MPFDGSEYRAVPASVEASCPPAGGSHAPSLWARVRSGRLAARLRGWPLWSFSPGEVRPATEVTAARLLRTARALIEEEDRWIQGRYETLRGRRCAMGALQAAARGLRHPAAFEAARDLLRTEALILGFSHVEKMNDRSSHAEVLGLFDRAIARAEGRGRG